ncbi:MAG: glucose-1-phosphate adenylyltransferase subunit GlgD, partial [Gemella haemolysans]|nr:glucose-1-phosphate adenylyltransferase subunit GlgD [Gemella haemolysans]
LNDLFLSGTDILTRVADSVPTTYGDGAIVKNSILGDGCEINGIVENSILFRDVVVEEGAVIKNSIVLPNCVIKKSAYLDCVILDKYAVVSEKVELKGTENCQVIVEKGKIVE